MHYPTTALTGTILSALLYPLSSTAWPTGPPIIPAIQHCMSAHSFNCYYQTLHHNKCQKLKDPRTYGDKGSYFGIPFAGPNTPIRHPLWHQRWQCEVFELPDCSNPTDKARRHSGNKDLAVFDAPGFESWQADWWFASYKCLERSSGSLSLKAAPEVESEAEVEGNEIEVEGNETEVEANETENEPEAAANAE